MITRPLIDTGAMRITAVIQTPYVISEAGALWNETRLTVENLNGACDAWVRVELPGHPDRVDAVGNVSIGFSHHRVLVPELDADGDHVTFEIYDNDAAEGVPLAATRLPQRKIKHWTVYVAHDIHMDIGYTDYQEVLRQTKWPAQTDAALSYLATTLSVRLT